jgi:hypothetical protein
MHSVAPGLLLIGMASINQAVTIEVHDAQPAPVVEVMDLSHIKDRSELQFNESDAYYRLLDHVRTVPDRQLRAAAAQLRHSRWEDSPKFRQWPESDFPLFYDMTQHPEEYRGRPVTMHGHLVRLVKYAAGDNAYGIETLYEGWLVTPDAETHPTTVICTGIPPGMPVGEELIDGVSVTGYFLKLHTYSSRDRKIRFAPMVLARTMTWSAPDASATGWPVSQPVMIAALVCLTLASGIIAWVSARRTRTLREARFEDDVPADAPEFLKDLTS